MRHDVLNRGMLQVLALALLMLCLVPLAGCVENPSNSSNTTKTDNGYINTTNTTLDGAGNLMMVILTEKADNYTNVNVTVNITGKDICAKLDMHDDKNKAVNNANNCIKGSEGKINWHFTKDRLPQEGYYDITLEVTGDAELEVAKRVDLKTGEIEDRK